MSFNIKKIPFSRYGSYLSVSYLKGSDKVQEGIYLRNIRGGDNKNGAVFKLDVLENGVSVPFEVACYPTYLQLHTEQGDMKLVMPEAGNVHVFGKHVGLRLTLMTRSYDTAFLYQDDRWQVNTFSQKIRFMLTPLAGKLKMDAPWHVNGCEHVVADFLPDAETGEIVGVIEEFMTAYQQQTHYQSFSACRQIVEKEYATWKEQVLPVAEAFKKGQELAAYITWSCIVKPEGKLTRPAMYMSKNWMTNIWSWDHCFNAMALAENNLELAWDQFMIFFDNQDESGLLPDYMNDEYAYWNCSKPPIHGWTLSWMLQRSKNLSITQLQEIYKPLVKWTNWYFENRDESENGFPTYHHGNDCGWDNSTVFAEGVPVESPDLCAFLVLQMDTLAQISTALGNDRDAKAWKLRADDLLEKMLAHFWDGEKFVAYLHGKKVQTGDSLLLYIPIVLGARLPQEIREKLIEDLKDESRFLTVNGLATESVKSSYYTPDGYWRGPIWAPSTMLLIDGIRSAGDLAFASELSRRFCRMANENGMAENYDALTGEGLRDLAFTWTSSVYLILANEYVELA